MKVVLCGAGFLGTNIAHALVAAAKGMERPLQLQIASRHPGKIHSKLSDSISQKYLLPPASVDITKPVTLSRISEGADVIVSLVGLLRGSEDDFVKVQWKGAENIARAAADSRSRVIHISAIGADPKSGISYARTKGLGEEAVLNLCPDATIVRPSIIFGPEDDFFNRFSRLSRYLPFLPVFGGGRTRFQPVYVGDIARGIEIMSRPNKEIRSKISGKITEAGGPDVLTIREMMELVLRYNGRRRPIVSIPFPLGTIQGAVMERLPTNLFTVTRAQVDQLRLDNIANPSPPSNFFSFSNLLAEYDGEPLRPMTEILPTYL